MKAIVLSTLVAFFASNAMAKSVTVTSIFDNPDAKMAGLSSVPQELLGILTDNGLNLKRVENGKFGLVAKNIHCDYRHRGAYSDVAIGGVPTEVCYMGSTNKKDSHQGRRMNDSRALRAILDKIQSAFGDVVMFNDCAMGYCGTWVKSVACVVDMNIEEFGRGRFSCALDDGQP